MALIERFEDIQAWQEARRLTRSVYAMTQEDPIAHDHGLRRQLQRAAVSSMSNIAEGFDCDSHREFIRFLGIARRSVVEVQSLLHVALDVGYINEDAFEQQYRQATKTKALIGGFMHALKKRT